MDTLYVAPTLMFQFQILVSNVYHVSYFLEHFVEGVDFLFKIIFIQNINKYNFGTCPHHIYIRFEGETGSSITCFICHMIWQAGITCVHLFASTWYNSKQEERSNQSFKILFYLTDIFYRSTSTEIIFKQYIFDIWSFRIAV